jgi:hypothetical protein
LLVVLGQVVLRDGVALVGGLAIPLRGEPIVARQPFAPRVLGADLELRRRVPAVGEAAEDPQRSRVVLRLVERRAPRELLLGRGGGGRSAAKPLERLPGRGAAHRRSPLVVGPGLSEVTGHTADAMLVGAAEIHQAIRIVLLGGAPVPLHGFGRVLRGADALLEHVAEHGLRRREVLRGGALQPGEGLGRVPVAAQCELVGEAETVLLVGRLRILADPHDVGPAPLDVGVEVRPRVVDPEGAERERKDGGQTRTSAHLLTPFVRPGVTTRE